jgi:4-hydroxy-3-methylbut-2-en-1-yl diphosphate reductase
MHIVIANPRGFCAGVERAVLMVERALEEFGAPVYVRHEIVHNRHVVDRLRQQGAVFVDDLAGLPANARVIFSAHGVSRSVAEQALALQLRPLDATCPLVTKVHQEVERHGLAGRSVILVGHAGHAEIEGTLGHFKAQAGAQIHLISNEEQAQAVTVSNPEKVAYATQTTLSVDDTARILGVLKRRFPAILGPKQDDICYATQNRQTAARELAVRSQVVLVVGAPHSSNTVRLIELIQQCGRPAHLIESAADIQRNWLQGCDVVGLTSGASVPEVLVDGVIAQLQAWWPGSDVESFGQPEQVVFSLPRELRRVVGPTPGSTHLLKASQADSQQPGVAP